MISQFAIVKIGSRNKTYYENKGYKIPSKKNSNNEKTILVAIKDLQKCCTSKIEVICDCCRKKLNIKWITYTHHAHENGEYYCLKCGNKLFQKKNELKTKLKNGKSFYEWCIEHNRQDILDRWDYDLNKCSPKDILYSSNGIDKRGYWFKCARKVHPSEQKSIGDFIRGHEGSINCKMCNSFAQWGKDKYGEDFLEKYWDWDKNNELGVNPWKISRGITTQKIWIKCQEKNCNNSFLISPCDFNFINCKCTKCSREQNESYLEEKVRLYLESLNIGTLLHEYDTLKCINPKTKYLLPYDNEIKELKLIIEVMGRQHYEISGWSIHKSRRNKTTPEYELHMQRVRDRYKRIYCKSQGYEYIAIPYWTDDENETWKQLINKKIKDME